MRNVSSRQNARDRKNAQGKPFVPGAEAARGSYAAARPGKGRDVRGARGVGAGSGGRRVRDARAHGGGSSSYPGLAPDGSPTQGAPKVPVHPVGARPSSARKRARRNVLFACLVLLAGVLCVAYPIVSNALQQSAQGKVISVQEDAVAEAPKEDLSAERAAAVDYNERLLNGSAVVTDPFDPEAQRPTDEEYEQVLNLNGDGVMGTLVIPAIHVNLPIYHGTSDEVLQDGVGHLEGTSVPIGGESTHAVLSGHTGLPSMKIFDALDQVKEGDYFIIQVLGEDHAYEVTSIETVLPDETDSLVIKEGKDLCTLVTCTPYGVNSHRLLVHAERCEVPEEWLNKGDADFPSGYSEPVDPAFLPSVLLGLGISVVAIGGYLGVQRWRSRRAAAAAAAAAGLAGAAGGRGGRVGGADGAASGVAGGGVVAAGTGAAAQPGSGLRPIEGPLPGNPYGRHVGPAEGLAAGAAEAVAPVIPSGRDRRGGAVSGAADGGASAAGSGAARTARAAGGASRTAGAGTHKPSTRSSSVTPVRPAGKRFKSAQGSAGASASSSQPATGNHGKRSNQDSSNPRGHHFK